MRFLSSTDEIILEIQHGSGGDDSKNFVDELLGIYVKYATNEGFSKEFLYSDYGHVIVKFSGVGVGLAFMNESGQHCIQRVPETEAKGRRQTSYVKVGILPIKKDIELKIEDKDIQIDTMRGSGPGGQNTNKVESSVRITHIPTNIVVRINGRDQYSNKLEAMKVLKMRLYDKLQSENNEDYAKNKRLMMGEGNRGDKIRTYNLPKNVIIDYRLGTKSHDIKGWMKGDLSKIYAI